jgi:insulysin
MKVALVGPQTLDALEKMARTTFVGVLNKKVPLAVHGSQPWLPEQLGHEVYIESVKTCRKISLTWLIPSFQAKYAEGTLNYLTFLVGHEGAGSLFAYLRQKGWATSLTSSTDGSWREYDLFDIEIELTTDALLHHREDIIVLVYQYLEMLRQMKPQERIWLELQKINQITFDNISKSEPVDTATNLVENLSLYPPKDLIRGPYATDVYNPKDIETTLSLLCPSNMLVVNLSKSFDGIEFDKLEKWYQVPYYVQPLSEKLVQKLMKIESLHPAFHLPLPNPFMPETLQVHPFPSILHINGHTTASLRAKVKRREETAVEFPKVEPMLWDEPECIVNNIYCRAWHLQDELYPMTPKMALRMFVHSPVTYSTPHEYVLTSIFCQLVADSLNEYTYDATQAGIKFDVSSAFEGISLSVSGFADKIPALALRLLSRIVDLEILSERFYLFKQERMRAFSNADKTQPQTQATDYMDSLTCHPRWTLEEKFSACDSLELEDMKYHKRIFLRQLKLDILLHGNIVRDNAIAFVEQVRAVFPTSRAVHPGQLAVQRSVALPVHTDVRLVKEGRDSANPNSAVVVWYQFCSYTDILSYQLLDLGARLISEKVYDTLRTKEQLGYSVFSESRSQSLSSGIRFVVQGSEHDAEYLLSRIDHCIYAVLIKYLEELTDEVFEAAKQAALAIHSETPTSLTQRSRDLWNIVEDGTCAFGRPLKDHRALHALTKQQVVNFMIDGFRRHARVSVLVQSLATANRDPSNATESKQKEKISTTSDPEYSLPSVSVLLVKDVYAFKNAFPLLPAGSEEAAKLPAMLPEPTPTMLDTSLQNAHADEENEESDEEEEEEEEQGESDDDDDDEEQ